jgi:hypothetical protein
MYATQSVTKWSGSFENVRPMFLRNKIVDFFLAVVLSAVFNALMFLCRPDDNLSSITTALFGAAAIFVALALPAAELGGQSVVRVADYWLNRSMDEADPPNPREAAHALKDVERVAVLARRGSRYALIAFVIAGFALFVPRMQWDAARIVRLDYLLTSTAFGCLLIGAMLFFPFAKSVYRLDVLQDAQEYFEGLNRESEQAALSQARPPQAHADSDKKGETENQSPRPRRSKTKSLYSDKPVRR